MARSIFPAPGSPKPVQRGSFSIGSGANIQVDVTVAAIDIAKARLSVNGYSVYSAGAVIGDSDVQWEIINSTTIRFSRIAASGSSPSIGGKWELESWA